MERPLVKERGVGLGRTGSIRLRRPGLGVGAAIVALLLLLLVSRRAPVAQPITFNHLKHTQDLSLGCEFCHPYVNTGRHAGLPNRDTCGICHQVPQGESAEAARVTQLLTQGEPLQFNKLFRLPAHVNYTHRRHVGIAKLECERCHGGIATTDQPPAHPLVAVSMDFCLACHRASGQSLDCVACHR